MAARSLAILHTAIWFFFTQIDVIIIGKLLGKEMLGFYSVAMHLASLPVQRVSGILRIPLKLDTHSTANWTVGA